MISKSSRSTLKVPLFKATNRLIIVRVSSVYSPKKVASKTNWLANTSSFLLPDNQLHYHYKDILFLKSE